MVGPNFVSAALRATRIWQRQRLNAAIEEDLQSQSQGLACTHSDPALVREHVRRLLELVQNLNEHLNAFSFVSRLPAELLVEIFQYIAELDDDGLSLVACSHVCRRWRVIAIASPRLWTRTIDFANDNEDLVTTLIQRSSPYPLDVSWDYNLTLSSWGPEYFLLHGDVLRAMNNVCCAITSLHRVREICLYAPLQHIVGILARSFPQFAPNLQTLILVSFNLAEVEEVDEAAGLSLPMLELGVPILHTLCIERLGVQLGKIDTRSLQNLQHLSLSHMPIGSKLSLPRAVEILFGIHLLKVLVLRQALQSPIPSNHALQISLPNLIMLIIEAPMIHTVLLLESISTPHLQMLEVYLEGVLPVGSTTDQMQFFSAVGAKARLTAYHTLFVALEEKFANVVGFLGTIAHDSAPLHSNTFHLSLEWDNPVPWDSAHGTALLELCRHFSLPCVQCLHFFIGSDYHGDIPTSTWSFILAMYPAVECLSILGTLPFNILDVLLDSTQSHPTHHSALLPHLHSISLMLDNGSQTILNEYLAQLSASYPMIAVEVVTS